MARIQVLPPETARLIAAGEVIDRPAAALRELLDNALDAGASEVIAVIRDGGIASIEVVDDGSGMDAEDLALALLPHATSKIRHADDLLRAKSLGFRGEALASIAAAARVEITSRTEAMREARRLVSVPGRPPSLEASQGRKGTRVLVEGLFDNFPARRQFLKRAQAEAALCRQVLVDKALAHPGVSFRYASEGRAQEVLPACAGRADRVHALFGEPTRDLVYEVAFSGEGFAGTAVVAGPSFYRNDRRHEQVFVNRRRVQDYGLLSGLDSAFEGLLPGGAHPYAFLFVEIDPALADFNIHPAKKEVRFRDPGSLRQAFMGSLRAFLGELVRARPESALPGYEELREASLFGDRDPREVGGSGPGFGPASGDAWSELIRERPLTQWRPEGAEPAPAGDGEGLRYLGTALGLFLVVERDGALYLIDQHAAHERLLFDELCAGGTAVQELLVPIAWSSESEAEDRRLAAMADPLREAGFGLEGGGGAWQVTSVPAIIKGRAEEAVREILAGSGENALRAARSMTACKAAVKDGEVLDGAAALELARRAFALPEPRCPHGRPLWIRLGREELFRLVRRIV